MKAIKIFSACLIVIISAGLFFSTSSCKKTEDNNEYSYRAAMDNYTAERDFYRAYSQISKAAFQVNSKSTCDTIQGCPVLYISGAFPERILTIDFGTGCTYQDGTVFKGRINTVMTGLYVDSAQTFTSTFENFYQTVNGVDHQIQGTQVITNMGHNNEGHPVYSVDVQGASITYNEGTIHWTSQRENEWVAGYDTYVNPWDDEYEVTGSAEGADINGAAFSVNITSPLLYKFCQSIFSWIIASGTIDIVNPGYPTITVDYGTGTCDLIVYVIINGTTYTLVLG